MFGLDGAFDQGQGGLFEVALNKNGMQRETEKDRKAERSLSAYGTLRKNGGCGP